jgi:hypothetical protein
MPRWSWIKFAVAAATLLASTSSSLGMTGERWIELCSQGATEAELASCSGYVRGVADMIQVIQQAEPNASKACIPYDKTGNDLVKVAFPRIAELPSSDRDKQIVVLLWGAFMLAYPCPAR